jgi:hypothetical protein
MLMYGPGDGSVRSLTNLLISLTYLLIKKRPIKYAESGRYRWY